jgi:hypothetical protein
MPLQVLILSIPDPTSSTPASLPLDHFERRFAVDLQAQFFRSDGQMPTLHPPQIFSHELTEKFEPRAMLAIPPTIGVNRPIRAACLAKIAMPALVRRSFKYRQRSGTRW